MAKRKRAPKTGMRTTLRLSDAISSAVTKIESVTGWSYGATVSFLCEAGIDLVYGGGKAGQAMADLMEAAIDKHNQQRVTEQMMASQNARYRQAQAALKAAAVAPAEIPDRPSHGGKVIVSGKRRPGRPRKHPVPDQANPGPSEASEGPEGSR